MKGLDSIVRRFILSHETGVRWLRKELEELHVNIPLTDGCLSEFVRDADSAVRQDASDQTQSYAEQLHAELTRRADFIRRWTGSDDDMTPRDSETLQSLVRIARKYALPRPWKLSEPVVVEYRRLTPSYWQWTDDIDTSALPQA